MAQQKPNIILIVCDDLGYGDLGCYGSKLNRTPRLDQMAAEGMRFRDFHVASPMCTPSRAAIMTGCYPQRVGFRRLQNQIEHVLLAGDAEGLNPAEITIPKLLKINGYVTKMVGKWHLGDQPEFLPTRYGFDSFFGLPYSHDIHPDHPLNERFNFPPLPLLCDETVIEENPDRSKLTQRFTREAIEFIYNHKDRPFFLYFGHTLPHAPLLPPKEYLEVSQNGAYGAYVELLDDCTGLLLDGLKEAGIDSNTLVIFTSDHGAAEVLIQPGSNGPLRGQKGQTFEGGMRVPCIMRWPDIIPPGSVNDEFAAAMDFLPTSAAISGTDLPQDRIIDGKNILPLLRGDPQAGTPYDVFFYLWMDELHAVRCGPWKLIFKEAHQPAYKKPMLYNLDEDIGETCDVSEAHPGIVAKLRVLADDCRKELGDAASGVYGKNIRPAGRVTNPVTLTSRPD